MPMYSIVGCAMAYIYFNKKEELSVAASLTPLFGQKIKYGFWRNVIDVVSIVALALGLSSNLGMGLALIGSGLEAAYGIAQGPIVWFTLFAIITATFTIASVAGLDKGIKWLANGTTKIFLCSFYSSWLCMTDCLYLQYAECRTGYMGRAFPSAGALTPI